MGILLFWMVLLFPIAEVYVLAKVGARIGFWDTIVLLILSGVFGSYLAKVQGKIALQRIQTCLAEGRMPTKEMMDGVLIFIGGLLFVFPGFISDILGLLLIFPPTRFLIRVFILGNIQAHMTTSHPFKGKAAQVSSKSKEPIGRKGVEDAQIVE